MKVRDYETELLEIEKAYNDEQALIKQCTEKLFEDMKEPMDFFIRKEFVTGEECANFYDAYNFAINETTDFNKNAIDYSSNMGVLYVPTDNYHNWCKHEKINFNRLQEMIFNFLNEKYTVIKPSSYMSYRTVYESKIFKKDFEKEVLLGLTKKIEIKELPPKIFNPVILGMAFFAIALLCIALTVSR